MADKSNWPAMMDVVTILKAEGDYGWLIGGYPLETPITDVRVRHTNKEVAKSRARQICALPQMVALLKGLAEIYMSYKSVDIDFQLDDYYKEAYEICKSIGEVE